MRNLILLIWKNSFFFLFLLLEAFCIYLVVQNNYYQRATFVSSSNAVTANILKTSQDIQSFFNLRTENELLVRENAALRARVLESYAIIVNDQHSVTDTSIRQKYTYTSANVVNNSTNHRNNYITLDKGSAQGINDTMTVITSNGIVGQVKDVSENFCTVMSVLHSKTTISATIKKDGSYGPLTWDGKDYAYATLSDIPTHVKLAAGDTIVTSPYSKYPGNIMIGTVDSWMRESGKYFYTIRVRLSTDFKKLEHVYIVNSKFQMEQDMLEKRSQHDKDEQ